MVDQPIVRGTIQNPPTTEVVTIPAFGQEVVFYAYDYFRVLEGTYSAGDLEFRFSDTGQPAKFVAGQGVKLTEVVGRVTIRNTTAAPITVTVALGIGNIYDDRLSVSGNLQVVNAAGTQLAVNDAALIALLQNDEVLRAPLTTLDGSSNGQTTTGETVLVTAAANTNGIIIRFASHSVGSSNTQYIRIGTGIYLTYFVGAAATGSVETFKDVHLPAGVPLAISSTLANSPVILNYEVL